MCEDHLVDCNIRAHYVYYLSDVTWTSWHLKCPAIRLFIQQWGQVHFIKAPNYEGSDWQFPLTNSQLEGNVHYDEIQQCMYGRDKLVVHSVCHIVFIVGVASNAILYINLTLNVSFNDIDPSQRKNNIRLLSNNILHFPLNNCFFIINRRSCNQKHELKLDSWYMSSFIILIGQFYNTVLS